jgi:hypothetical protein
MSKRDYKWNVDAAVPIGARDAFVAQLLAELPEARVIKRVIDEETSRRVLTFELLSEEPASR